MIHALALALTVAGVIWARRIAGEASEPSAGTALVLGFTLIGAWLARRPGAPRRGASVAQQFEADLSLLRARA